MEPEQKYYDIILKRVADFNKNFEPETLFGSKNVVLAYNVRGFAFRRDLKTQS